MSLSEKLFRITRNFVFCHFLNGYFLFLVGWFYGLSTIVLWASPVLFYGAALILSRDAFREFSWGNTKESLKSLPQFPLIVIFLFLTLNFLFSLLPPAEHIEADSLLYHLTIPWQYYLRGGVVPLAWSMNDKFPLYLQMTQLPFMAATFPWVIKVWVIFSLPALLVVVWALAGFFGFERREKTWIVAMVSALALLIKQYGAANFDIINTVYILFGFYYLVRAAIFKKRSDIFWGGLLLGMACAVKTFLFAVGFVWVFGFILWRLIFARSRFEAQDLFLILSPCFAAVVFMAPFLIRNAMLTGNPFFPLFENLLGPPALSLLHSQVLEHARMGYGYGRSPLDFILMPFRMVWPLPNPIMRFDYWTDPILLLFLTGTFFSLRGKGKTPAGFLAILAFLLYTILFWGSQQARYFYPVWILVTLLGGGKILEWFGEKSRNFLLGTQMLLGVCCFFFFHRDALANLKYLPKGEYLQNISFSYVWNQNLAGLPTQLLCLRQAPGDSIVDVLYFTVPIKILGNTTSLFPFEEKYADGCDRFMIGTQWPASRIYQPEGKGNLVSKKEFFNARFGK